MPEIPVATFFIRPSGSATIAPGLPDERCVRTAEARGSLPKGTITIDADDCYAVAAGDGTFHSIGLDGTFPAHESVVLPAYIIAGPGLPVLIPEGGATLASQGDVDRLDFDFEAVDADGSLFKRDFYEDDFGAFIWEAAGQVGSASPVFPITAWR